MLLGPNWGFVHVARTGGTAITLELMERMGTPIKDPKENLQWCKELQVGGWHEGLTKDGRGRFTFGFVRNPYTRWVSLYRHFKKFKPRFDADGNKLGKIEIHLANKLPLFEFLNELSRRPACRWCLRSQANQMRWQDLEVDYVGRYENLQDDWDAIQRELGWDPKPLRQYNESPTAPVEHDDDSLLWVAMHSHEDLETYGYGIPTWK